MKDTTPLLMLSDFPPNLPPIRRHRLETLQANLGYRCNQSCTHCHVAAGPNRTEEMDWDTMSLMLAFCAKHRIHTLDLTGGAPEMNPHFRRLVEAARALGISVMVRCNLTILQEPGYETMVDFYATHRVLVVASLPCYLEDNVNRQRGDGVFQASIRALQHLNAKGYGQEGSGLVLNLVYNPMGAVLPPAQEELTRAYKHHLHKNHGIVFNQLFVLANMPIARFGAQLLAKNTFTPYINTLKQAFNESTLSSLMCTSLISLDWQGYVYDCDFNQMLGLPLGDEAKTTDSPHSAHRTETAPHQRVHLSTLLTVEFNHRPIRTALHCYACTAGQGSSCGGALEAQAA